MQKQLIALAVSATIALTGCSREGSESNQQSDAPASSTAEVASSTPAPTNAAAVISLEDIDRWQRGMQAEAEAVQAAAAKLAEAPNDDAKMEALQSATETGTIEPGAEAAGVSPDQYRRIRNTLSNAVSQLSPIEMEMDVTSMPAEVVEQMKQARATSAAQLEQELPADVFAALQTRAAALREQQKRLVGERLKVATSAR